MSKKKKNLKLAITKFKYKLIIEDTLFLECMSTTF